MKTPWMEIIVRVLALTAIVSCTCYLVMEDGYADDYMTAAVGIANSGKDSHAETKFLNMGHRDYLGLGITHQYELGGWVDIAGRGRSSSGYAAYQLGVETDGSVFARVMAGPAVITTPDAYLGGYLAFTEDFYFGLRGSNNNTVGILYKHISNAGLFQPNVGRDIAGVQISIPF